LLARREQEGLSPHPETDAALFLEALRSAKADMALQALFNRSLDERKSGPTNVGRIAGRGLVQS
jgi:hypothetical protein